MLTKYLGLWFKLGIILLSASIFVFQRFRKLRVFLRPTVHGVGSVIREHWLLMTISVLGVSMGRVTRESTSCRLKAVSLLIRGS